jgi:protein SCO1/2
MQRSQWGALLALAFLLAVTAAWWAFALWPTPSATPEWLARARFVCFNTGPDGMPDASGWLLLMGQPIGMLAALMAVWGREVRAGLRGVARSSRGKAALVACAGALLLGIGAAADRVAAASAAREVALYSAPPPDTYPRLDRQAPALSLVDQRGERIDLEALRGRPALVTFAFGSCETVCPAVVKQTLEAREQLRERAEEGDLARDDVPRVVIISLDPWRDTPGRLSHLAMHWQLDEDAHVLSGGVEEVEAVLDAWNVARQRDPKTGDVTHPPLVYLLDAESRIAFATSGGTTTVATLATRL